MNPTSVYTPSSTSGAMNELKATSEDILMRHETPETQMLSGYQLQRIVLLQQLKVLTLQRMKLERDLRIGPHNISDDFEFIEI